MRRWAMALLLAAAMDATADDAMQAAARDGEAVGGAELRRDPLPTLHPGGEREQGVARIGADEIDVNRLIPGGSTDAAAALSQLAGDRARIDAAVAERLRDVANDPSHSGQALRSVTASQHAGDADSAAAIADDAPSRAKASPLIADLGACTATWMNRPGDPITTHAIHEAGCEIRFAPPADSCAALAADPACRLVRSGCHEDGLDPAGRCVAESRVYHCTEAVATPSVVSRLESTCASTIRCMGDDCVRPAAAPTGDGDLARATAALSVSQHLVDDWVLRPRVDPRGAAPPGRRDTAELQWLPGAAYHCRRQVGGPLDCCSETRSDRGAGWFAAYQSATRRSGAAALVARLRGERADEHGSWTALGDPARWNDSALDRPLTSPLETVTAGREGVVPGPVSGGIHEASADYLATARERDGPGSGLTCNAEERELARLREIGSCLLVGGYCESAGGADGCREKRDGYVCYDSPTARVLREAIAGPGAVERGDFGTPRHPKVDGLGSDAARQLRVEPAMLDEIAARLTLAGAFPDADQVVAASSEERLTGAADLHGDPLRPSVGSRTRDRLAGSDLRAVAKAVERDQRERLSAAIGAADGPGDLAFDPALVSVRGGQLAQLAVTRNGGRRGAVTVEIATRDGTAKAPDDYRTTVATLAWADGEGGERRIAIPTRAAPPGRGTRTLEARLAAPGGGARLYPNDRAQVLIDTGGEPPSAGEPAPPPPGAVSVRKWIPSAADGHVAAGSPFGWQILISNATTAAVPLIELVDRLPPNLPSAAVLRVDCHADGAATATMSVDVDGRVLRCRWPAGAELSAGSSARMDIALGGLAAGAYRNTCEVDLGPTAVQGTCASTADVRDPAGDPGPPAGCPAPPSTLRRRDTPTRWEDVFDGRLFPASRDVAPLVTDLGRYVALAFHTRAAGSGPVGVTLSWDALQRVYPSVLPDGDFYVTVTRCPGDFSLGRWPSTEPSESPGCRSIRRDARGSFFDAGGLLLHFDGVPDRDSCHLAPSTRYYLNVVFADPRPQAFGAPLFPNLSACPVGYSTCGVQAVTSYSGQ